MDNLLFGVKDFHAIGHAKILLNGITVLAGINGCGKSTIARSVYSIVNSLNEYDKIQQERFCRILAREIDMSEKVLYSYNPLLKTTRYQFSKLLNTDEDFEEASKVLFFSLVEKIVKRILDRAEIRGIDIPLQRASKHLLGEDAVVEDVDEFITKYRERCNIFFYKQLEQFHTKIEGQTIDNLNLLILQEFPDCESTVKISSFVENGTELLNDNHFLSTLTLDRAIYVDTPMVLNMDDINGKTVWGRFQSLMFEKNTDIIQDDDKFFKLRLILQTTIGGNVIEINDMGQKELHYKSNNGLDLEIKNTATGIKSFAYILRLLDNGWLNSQSLLIIDEPEAHLHPQWVVEFAKILVLLQKDLGVKILVASHNPDMVAAIHDIAEYYKLSDRTNFYIAEPNEENKYDYRCLGSEIGDIFEAFNVALVKIRDYSVEE